MTFLVKGKKHHSVVFRRRAIAKSNSSSSIHFPSHDKRTQQPGLNLQELPQTEQKSKSKEFLEQKVPGTPIQMAAATARSTAIPDIFTSLPPLRDLLNTETSQIQEETIQECLPFLSGAKEGIYYNVHGVPNLDIARHIQFLHKSLKKLPAPYVAADASRPWMFYWALAGLSAMGEDITEYRERLISTVIPIQNITGGFGGGNGQMSHLAPTYAIILALAMVGGREALDLIDRKAMWKWLGALKQPGGGFQMSVGGEEDVR